MAKEKNAKVCCILLLWVLLAECANMAFGVVVSVVAEVVTLPARVLGLVVDSLIP